VTTLDISRKQHASYQGRCPRLGWGGPLALVGSVGMTVGTDADGDVRLSWPAVTTDTRGEREVVTQYEIHRSRDEGFTPSAETLVATATAPPFGSATGGVEYTDRGAAEQGYSYVVRVVNGAGRFAESSVVNTSRLWDTD
jgi:hypothetical protein